MSERIYFMSRKALLAGVLAVCGSAASGCATTDPALADEIAGLREEVRALRAEIQELKKPLVMSEPLSIQLPENAVAKPDGPDVVVSILADGKLVLGEKAVSREELKAALAGRAAGDPKAMVVIQVDDGLSHRQIVEVMELIKAAGIDRIGIATGEK